MGGKEDDKSDEKARLRIGRYRTQNDKGQGVERPFVYVPAGFDVAQGGGVGQILKAAGVMELLGDEQPRMILRVPKQTKDLRVEDTAAVRERETVDSALWRKQSKLGKPPKKPMPRAKSVVRSGSALHLAWRRSQTGSLLPRSTKNKGFVDKDVVLITSKDAEREDLELLKPDGDGDEEDGVCNIVVKDDQGFKIVDEVDLEMRRAVVRGKVGRLMRSVVACCAETRAIMTFDNARRGNSQLDLFSDSSESLVSLGTYEAKDLVAWLSVEEQEPDGKPVEGNDPWWHETTLRNKEFAFLREKTIEDPSKEKDPNTVDLPEAYTKRPREGGFKNKGDRVRDVPHENVTHALFFSSDAQRRQFDTLLSESTIQGLMLVGGPPHAFKESLDALREGKPIFVFDETGGAASLFAAMHRARVRRQDFKTRQKELDDAKAKQGCCSLFQTTDKNSTKLLDLQWLNNHPWPGPNAQEAMCIAQNWQHLWGDEQREKGTQLRVWKGWPGLKSEDKNEKDKEKMKVNATGQAVLDAIATEGAWPPAANDSAIYVMDPSTSSRTLQDDITRIMLTVEDQSEVGALEAESDLIMDAWAQWDVFSRNARTQGRYAKILYVPLIVLTLATVVLATYESFLNLRSSHRDRRKYLRYAITIIPLIAALLIAMYAKWQPMTKWAKLKLAARQVESEIYRFRMRVGEYAPRRRCRNQAFASPDKTDAQKDDESLRPPDKSSRVCFSDALAKIWETVQDSEVARGALQAQIDRKLDNKVSKVHKSGFESALIKNDDGKKGSQNLVKPLMPEEYLQQRVYPKLGQRLEKAPQRSHVVGLLQFGIFLCTFGAALCGALNAPLLVPVVLAISAAIGSVIEFGLYPQVLRANNSTIAELKSIDIWWHGLTSSQRRSMLCKDILVSRTEYILNLEIAYVSQLAFKQDRRIASGDNDDDDAAKEKKKENDPTKNKSSGATKSG